MKLPKENRDKREFQSKTGSDIKHETGNTESVCVCVCYHDTRLPNRRLCIRLFPAAFMADRIRSQRLSYTYLLPISTESP